MRLVTGWFSMVLVLMESAVHINPTNSSSNSLIVLVSMRMTDKLAFFSAFYDDDLIFACDAHLNPVSVL